MTDTQTSAAPQSTRTLLRGIWCHLSRRRRIQLGLLLVVMLASGGAAMGSQISCMCFCDELIEAL
jgi:ATP-binding cassette, subfamily B, bacterial PglK